jgi:hypothetical protein
MKNAGENGISALAEKLAHQSCHPLNPVLICFNNSFKISKAYPHRLVTSILSYFMVYLMQPRIFSEKINSN